MSHDTFDYRYFRSIRSTKLNTHSRAKIRVHLEHYWSQIPITFSKTPYLHCIATIQNNKLHTTEDHCTEYQSHCSHCTAVKNTVR